jgi:integrase/recombinase XerC
MDYYKENELRQTERLNDMLREFPDYISRFIFSIQYTTTIKTRIGYLIDIKSLFDYLSEDLEISNKEITVEHLGACSRTFFDDFLNYMRLYRKNDHLYSNDIPALKRKLSSIKNLYSYLYSEELIAENITEKVKIPKLRKKEIIRLDEDETKRLIREVDTGTGYSAHKESYHKRLKTRDLAIVTLLLSTGIRISELTGINMTDVDFTKSCIHITRKGDKQDTVYFSDEAEGYLKDYMIERLRVVPVEGYEDALFLSSQRKRMTARNIQILVKNYATVAVPSKKITPHKLRATFGSRLYEESSDIYLVAQALGHNSVDTSSRYYVTTDDKKKRNARNLIQLNADNDEE